MIVAVARDRTAGAGICWIKLCFIIAVAAASAILVACARSALYASAQSGHDQKRADGCPERLQPVRLGSGPRPED